MRLFIDYKLNNSGKGKFLRRLIPALESIGVSVRFKPGGCDVALGISKWLTKTSIPKVLRVDGIHLSGSNDKIRRSMKVADAIIFQSKFARRYIKEHMKVPKRKDFVIYNGADPKDYQKALLRYGSLMAAHWGHRKHKRFDLHMEYIMDHPEEPFVVAGDCRRIDAGNASFVGDTDILHYYQSRCAKLVYLADLDWCPNVVVESRVAGMDVVYNPKCEAVKELCDVPVEELYIDNTAKQYKKVFRYVLR